MEFLQKFAMNLLLLMFLFYPVYRKIPKPSLESDHSKLTLLIALAVLAVLILAFYPGVMVYDSYEQYWQAIHFWFVDWHPPVMALLWSATDRIIKGSGGMLLLQLTSIVYSFYLLSRVAARKDKKRYWLPLFAVFLPFVSCCIFFLIKDVSLAVSLLLAFSLWYFYRAAGKLNWPRMLLILLILF
ncbi:hypothetical protein L0156_04475 [bacterium]|nr:hypothetical protein [bacterium]